MNDTPRRFIKGFFKFLLILLAIIVIAVAGLLFYITSPYFTGKLGTYLTHTSGRNIALEGRIEMHVFQREPRFIFHGVKVGNAEWSKTPTMFEADKIEFAILPWELLKGRIVFTDVDLTTPKVVLEKNEKGDANWNFTENPQAQVLKKPLPSSRFSTPVINRLNIEDGDVTYRDPVKHIDTTLKISTVQGNMEMQESIELHGKGTYQKAPFKLDVTGASILELRESSKPYPFSIHTDIGNTHADVKGTVQDPIKGEAFDVTLDISGANAADIFPITGIALPPTPAYKVRGHLTREGDDWKFSHLAGKLGASDLKGDIVWHPKLRQPYFEGNFVSDNLNMADLAGFVGAHKQPDDPTRVIPDAPLDISRLLAMDADVTFRGRHVRTPNLLDDFYMKISLKDGVLWLHPVSFGIADGSINADIKIEGKKTPPVATLNVEFKRLSLNALFEPLAERYGKDNVSAGLLGGKAELKGTGKSLRDILATSDGNIGIGMEGGILSKLLLNLMGLDLFRTAGLLLTGDAPVPISCVVGDFSVKGGILDTRALLVNTDVTTIRGKGTINLQNEALDLRLYVSPHKASLVSARSPIDIGGTFKHPKIGLDPVALGARGGAAALLALLAPPAALLAFIEPGLGTNGDCAGFIHKMDQDLSHAKSVPTPPKK